MCLFLCSFCLFWKRSPELITSCHWDKKQVNTDEHFNDHLPDAPTVCHFVSVVVHLWPSSLMAKVTLKYMKPTCMRNIDAFINHRHIRRFGRDALWSYYFFYLFFYPFSFNMFPEAHSACWCLTFYMKEAKDSTSDFVVVYSPNVWGRALLQRVIVMILHSFYVWCGI